MRQTQIQSTGKLNRAFNSLINKRRLHKLTEEGRKKARAKEILVKIPTGIKYTLPKYEIIHDRQMEQGVHGDAEEEQEQKRRVEWEIRRDEIEETNF